MSELENKMSDEEYDLLCFIEQIYLQKGKVPTVEFIGLSGFKEDTYFKAIKKVTFRDGLIARGIRLNVLEGLEDTDSDKPWKQWALTEEQLSCANVLLDFTDTRSRAKKLSELGITTAKYQSWLRDPAFQGYLRDRSEGVLQDNQHEAHLALVDRVSTGDINAIKYYNELSGRFVPNKNSNVDIGTVLLRVIEVIQRHVQDPVALTGIGSELMALSEAMNSSAQPVPQVIKATPRELGDV
jgi:hypothetical protein